MIAFIMKATLAAVIKEANELGLTKEQIIGLYEVNHQYIMLYDRSNRK